MKTLRLLSVCFFSVLSLTAAAQSRKFDMTKVVVSGFYNLVNAPHVTTSVPGFRCPESIYVSSSEYHIYIANKDMQSETDPKYLLAVDVPMSAKYATDDFFSAKQTDLLTNERSTHAMRAWYNTGDNVTIISRRVKSLSVLPSLGLENAENNFYLSRMQSPAEYYHMKARIDASKKKDCVDQVVDEDGSLKEVVRIVNEESDLPEPILTEKKGFFFSLTKTTFKKKNGRGKIESILNITCPYIRVDTQE